MQSLLAGGRSSTPGRRSTRRGRPTVEQVPASTMRARSHRRGGSGRRPVRRAIDRACTPSRTNRAGRGLPTPRRPPGRRRTGGRRPTGRPPTAAGRRRDRPPFGHRFQRPHRDPLAQPGNQTRPVPVRLPARRPRQPDGSRRRGGTSRLRFPDRRANRRLRPRRQNCSTTSAQVDVDRQPSSCMRGARQRPRKQVDRHTAATSQPISRPDSVDPRRRTTAKGPASTSPGYPRWPRFATSSPSFGPTSSGRRWRPGAITCRRRQHPAVRSGKPLDDVHVLIVGQDPYPTPGHPVGLCFSVAPDVRPLPRSLVNIYTEMRSDLGETPPVSGDLTPWTEQGVLLLNRVLTVSPGKSGGPRRGRAGRRSRRPPSRRWWRGAARSSRSSGVARPSRSPPCSAASPASSRPTPHRCRPIRGSSARARSAGPTRCWSPPVASPSTGG